MLAFVVVVASLPLLVVYLYSLAHYRRLKRFAHLPQSPPSLLWGHLLKLRDITARGRPKQDGDYTFGELHEELGRPPLFLVDLWPMMSHPMAVVTSHAVAEQLTRASPQHPWSVPKSPTAGTLEFLTGRRSLLTAPGEQWRVLRKRFNPAFAPAHLMTLLPCILDKTWLFLRRLDAHAAHDAAFTLHDLCVDLTFDIIGKVTMDQDFDAQLPAAGQHPFIALYRELVDTYTRADDGGVPIPAWVRPLLHLRRWRCSRRVDGLLKNIIRQKFAEKKEREQEGEEDGDVVVVGGGTEGKAAAAAAATTTTSPDGKRDQKRDRSVLALSLQDTDVLSPDLVAETADQLKTFLFAGHDTTSILLQWTFYELSRTPRARAALCAELDALFGPDPHPAAVRDRLLAPGGEDLLRRMAYTSAVVKEALRLYPPAATARFGTPGCAVTLPPPAVPAGGGHGGGKDAGQTVRLDGLVLYLCHRHIMRDGAVYGDSRHDFVPERWLGDSDTTMRTNGGAEVGAEKETAGAGAGAGDGDCRKVPASAWRPFERGPRNCIGQELANIEARVILACTARRYDFAKVGVGALVRDGDGQPVLDERTGQYKVESELYNMRQITTKPVDGTLVTVKLADGAKPLED